MVLETVTVEVWSASCSNGFLKTPLYSNLLRLLSWQKMLLFKLRCSRFELDGPISPARMGGNEFLGQYCRTAPLRMLAIHLENRSLAIVIDFVAFLSVLSSLPSCACLRSG